MRVIIHGGAGSVPDEPEERQTILDEAAAAGADAKGVVGAIVRAVRVLESSPRFNAGVGSAVQSDGVPRTDAGLMTADCQVGAACSMPGVEHPVEVARVIAEQTPHVLIAGVHAVDLAAASGVDVERDLWTDHTHERWRDLDPPEGDMCEHLQWVRERFGSEEERADGLTGGERNGSRTGERDGGRSHDTVGAVAARDGRVAAATSTGGRWCALAGRVGDVPQVGSGFYCAPTGGASATGAGEDIARMTLSRRTVDLLDGRNPQAAAEQAIEEFGKRAAGTAGVVVMDADGTPGSAYDSELMQTSVAGE